MKKTFMAMLLLGGTVSMFAQTPQPSTPTTGNGSTSSSTTTQPTTTQPTTTQPSTTQPSTTQPATTQPSTSNPTNSTMNSGVNTTTTDPNATNTNVNNTTNSANGTMNANANANWNGVSASTSWTPTTPPSYNWTGYNVWPGSTSLYPNTTAGGYPIPQATADASASMNSTSANAAYSGTAVSALPANVQLRFNQDFPTAMNNNYTWSQYGDWFHTYYVNNGRLWQYHYSSRGDGYALALPVIQTYVPENIITSAIQKFGSSLYSIAMVKTNGGNSAYQVGLLQGGQLAMQYLDDNGVTVADVWRVEDSSSMNSTQANAAMDSSSMNNGNSSSMSTDATNQSSTSTDANSQSATSTDMNSQSTDANTQSADKSKSKMKIKNADGSETKIKVKDGEMKVKNKPATNDSTTNDQQQPQ